MTEMGPTDEDMPEEMRAAMDAASEQLARVEAAKQAMADQQRWTAVEIEVARLVRDAAFAARLAYQQLVMQVPDDTPPVPDKIARMVTQQAFVTSWSAIWHGYYQGDA